MPAPRQRRARATPLRTQNWMCWYSLRARAVSGGRPGLGGQGRRRTMNTVFGSLPRGLRLGHALFQWLPRCPVARQAGHVSRFLSGSCSMVWFI
eukprot:gene16575-biopygen9797